MCSRLADSKVHLANAGKTRSSRFCTQYPTNSVNDTEKQHELRLVRTKSHGGSHHLPKEVRGTNDAPTRYDYVYAKERQSNRSKTVPCFWTSITVPNVLCVLTCRLMLRSASPSCMIAAETPFTKRPGWLCSRDPRKRGKLQSKSASWAL